MPKAKKTTRARYTDDHKRAVVEHSYDYGPRQAALDAGIHESMIYAWRKKFRGPAPTVPAPPPRPPRIQCDDPLDEIQEIVNLVDQVKAHEAAILGLKVKIADAYMSA